MPRARGTLASVILLALVGAMLVPAAAQASRANVAALQSALTRLHLYHGFVDGVRGPLTRSAVVRFQRRRGLTVDGIAGPQTRHALGRWGRPRLGSRVMRLGNRGWDVAALQYLLQRRGYGPGIADGIFGGLTQAAVLRAQSASGIGVDGLAGRQTIRSLHGHGSSSENPGPGRVLRPVPGPIADGFGAPRAGGRRHQGVDFPVAYGTRIGAAAPGTTIFAGRNYGGYGNLVVVQHPLGYTTWYAHMSSITTWVGESLSAGTRLGYVGSTGYSTGPHLHFEIRRYNTPVDPAPLLLGAVASRQGRARAETRRDSECAAGDRSGGVAAPRGSSWIARERLCKG
jgi:murein DD-endopeptidase MepM/ murein hydrolase activator NlpD